MSIINKIIYNFENNNKLYIGEKVTMSEHMLQTAMLAEKNNSSNSLVCACLLHDYGHFIVDDPDMMVSKSIDANHELIGYDYLKNYFTSAVTEPIKLHVDAKRFLCRDKSYYNQLSTASKTSLKLQGNPMNDEEAKNFQKLKYFNDAIEVRKYDDGGKDPNIKIKNIGDFKELLNSQLIT